MRRPVHSSIVVAFAFALAGCNSAISPATNVPCALPAGVSAVLVSPAPGSPNNDTAPPQIVVATTAPIPSSWAVVLVVPPSAKAGAARFGGTLQTAQPPFPSPPSSQLPTYPNPVYYASGFGIGWFPLPHGTAITAALYDTSTNCSPGIPVGTFVTST